jgi:hypothetical protein
MFGTIRRHQQWLWVVIISLTILSFVIFFSPYQKVSRTRGSTKAAVCYLGNRVVTAAEFDAALREVYIGLLCKNGTIPDPAMLRQIGFDPEQRTYQRLALVEKAKELRVHVGEEPASRLAAEVVNGFRQDGITSYSDFVNRILGRYAIPSYEGRAQLTGADFERFVRNELAIEQVVAMNGLGGNLVVPQEAEEIYRRQNESLETEGVFFHSSNFLASVKVTPEALAEFYTNTMPNYKIAERAVLDYVRFPGSNYYAAAEAELAKLTNLSEAIDAAYLQRGTNAFPGKTPEEAKAAIKNEERDQLALQTARLAANQFVTEVFAEETNRLARLHALAAKSNLVVQVTEPFEIEKDEGPKEFTTPSDFTNILARLTPDDPVAGRVIQNKDAVYVISLVRRIPSQDPSYDTVKARVEEDYKREQSLNAARNAGAVAAPIIKKEVAAGKSFADACAAAQVSPVKLPAFTLTTHSDPEIEKYASLSEIEDTVFLMAAGEVSAFRPTADGGFIIHFVRRLPVDEEKMKKEMPQFISQVRQARVNEALNLWYRKLFESGYLQIPQRESKNPSAPPPSPG